VAELEHALALARAARDRALEAESFRELGLVYEDQSEYARAISYREQALRIYREIGNRMGEGRALNALGAIYLHQYDQARARRYGEQGLRLCRETGNRWDEAWGLHQLGRVCRAEGDYLCAMTRFRQALRIMREIGAQASQMFVLLGMGIVYRLLGNYDRALELYERLLHSPYASRRAQAWAMANKGLLLHDTDDDVLARECCERALSIRGSDYQFRRAWMSTLLGHVLAGLGHLAEAQEVYRESRSLLRDLDQYHLSIAPLSGLAHVALASGRPVQALAYAEEVLSYLDAHPALDAIGELFRQYLTCYHVLRGNEDPRATEVLSQAYRVLQEWADKIEDEDLRRSFLENVAVNREIVREFAKRDRGTGP
jgi:tetratricopeptide (TPR) repeat protein